MGELEKAIAARPVKVPGVSEPFEIVGAVKPVSVYVAVHDVRREVGEGPQIM